MKNQRNKDVTEEDLIQIFERIDHLENEFLQITKQFLTEGKMYSMDLFTSAIVNRSISLMRGFSLLAKDENYICAVPIIRMQIDNCLRFYASMLVTDCDAFFIKYLQGEHIRKIKDAAGKLMTDGYLIQKLEKIFPGIQNLYENTSGYIHFSNSHSFLHAKIKSEEERTLNFQVGTPNLFEIDKKVDFSYNMMIATEFLLKLISAWNQKKQELNRE